MPLPAALFKENRDRLRALMLPRSLAVVNANDIPTTNADGTAPAWANSDLFYLSGVGQEESILLLAPDAHDEKSREILFVRETSDLLTIWEGHKLTKEEARERSGIARVEWTSAFPGFFRRLMCEMEHVYLNANEHPRADDHSESRDLRFVRETQRAFPLHRYERLARLMHQLRPVKSKHEIEAIKAAADLTTRGYDRVMKFVQPGVNEREIEAEFAHEFIRGGGRFAYQPIIAAGKNANVLHYVSNDQPCKKGDLLLLDVAAGLNNYNSDVTRVLPVSGKFTPRQREVYESVLRVLRQATDALVPGKLPKDWQKESDQMVEEELLRLKLLKPKDIKNQDPERPARRKYFMHGTGHPLGLDVHDVSTIGAPFEENWVMTVEPGIYIAEEGFGVRLEDDIVVRSSGNVNLTAEIPIEVKEIEATMKRGKR